MIQSDDNFNPTRKFLTASAGSGKTFAVTEELYDLIRQANTGCDTMCVTFTNAGAAEMKSRIFSRIQNDRGNTGYQILRLLNLAGQIKICTFDSFFYSLYSSWENSLSKIVDDKEKQLLLEETVMELLGRTGEHPSSLSELFMAASILDTDIEYLLEELENEGISFHSISSDQLMEERKRSESYKQEVSGNLSLMKSEIRKLFDSGPDAGNFTRWVLLPINNKSLNEILSGNFPSCLTKNLDDYTFKGKAEKLLEDNSSVLHSLWNLTLLLRHSIGRYMIQREFLRYYTLCRLYNDFSNILDRRKEAGDILFFKDIGRLLIEKVIDRNIADNLYYLTGYSRIKNLFMDEFQDSSEENLKIIEPLITQILSTRDPDHRILIVGDWKQSIYQWRGADRENTERLMNLSGIMPELVQSRLKYNWRSAPVLIEFFNLFVQEAFKHSPEANDLQLFPESKRNDQECTGEVAYHKLAGTSSNKDRLWEFGAAEISRFVSDRCTGPYACDVSDCCVLVRSRNDKDRVIKALELNGLDSSELKGVQFLSTAEGLIVYNAVAFLLDCENTDFYKLALPDELFSDIVQSREEFLQHWEAPCKYGFLSSLINRFSLDRYARTIFISRFLSEAAGFFENSTEDLNDFLTYFFKIREHVTIPVPEQRNRVRISTIHGSKGLQFRHVFIFLPAVSDKCSYFKHPSRDEFLRFTKDTILLLKSSPAGESSEIAEIIAAYEANVRRNGLEEKNNLYVAATRAEDTLTFFAEESAPASALLDHILSTGTDSAAGYVTTCTQQENSTVHKMAGTVLRQPVLKNPVGGSDSLSQLQRFSPPEEGAVHWEFDVFKEEVTQRGTALHHALERLTESMPESKKEFMDSVSLDKANADILWTFINDPAIREIVFRTGKVFNEISVSDTISSGIIDRLIRSDSLVTIIDYKSHQQGHRIDEELLEQYISQLRRYRGIIGNIYPHHRIESYLLFIDDRKIIKI